MSVGDARGLGRERGALAAVEAGAPSTALAHAGTTALPGLDALLGALPVVGLGDGAVVVVGAGLLVGGPVTLVEHLRVVEIEEMEFIILELYKGSIFRLFSFLFC